MASFYILPPEFIIKNLNACENVPSLIHLPVNPPRGPREKSPVIVANNSSYFQHSFKAVGLEQKVVCGKIKNGASEASGYFMMPHRFQSPSNERWVR